MTSHAQVTEFLKPQVDKSRGISGAGKSRTSHASHEFRKTAGREVTRQVTQITGTQVTIPSSPLGEGIGMCGVAPRASAREITDMPTTNATTLLNRSCP